MDGTELEEFIQDLPEYGQNNRSPFQNEWSPRHGVVSRTDFRDDALKDGKYEKTEAILQKYKSNGMELVRKGFGLRLETADYENDVKEFKNELRILRHAQHYHVINLVYAYTYNDIGVRAHAAIIMPNIKFTLAEKIEGRSISQKQMLRWLLCLATVLEHLHSIGIRHRDIKPLNILVSSDEEDDNCTEPGTGKILLADFGISKMGLERTLSTTQPGVQKSRTEGYCAPEVEDGSSRGQTADIFSMGAVFMEIYTSALKLHCESNNFRDLLLGKERREGQVVKDVVRNVARLQDLIGEMKEKLVGDSKEIPEQESWKHQILGLCQRMLDDDRTKRPDTAAVVDCVVRLSTTQDTYSPCECTRPNKARKYDLLSLCKKETCTEEDWLKLEKLAEDPDLRNTQGALQLASARGPLGTVERLLRRGFDPGLEDFSGQTALHCAAGRGRDALAIVDCILSYSNRVDTKDSDGRWPIHHASGRGNAEVVHRLLEQEHNNRPDTALGVQDYDGRTVLHHAASGGHANVIKVLMQKGKEAFGIISQSSGRDAKGYRKFLDRTDKIGRTALHLTAQFGSVAAVKCLLPDTGEPQSNVNMCVEVGDRIWTAVHFSVNGVRRGGEYKELTEFLMHRTEEKILADPSTDCKPRLGSRPCRCERKNGADLVCRLIAEGWAKKGSLQELHEYIQPARHYDCEEMTRISRALENAFPRWHENGYTVARIYTVLSISDVPLEECAKETDEFIQRGITDYRLPLADTDLPAGWKPGRRSKFCKSQTYVLSQRVSLEELGRHSCLEHDDWENRVEKEEVLFQERVFSVKVGDHPISLALKLVDLRGQGALGQKLARSELGALKRARHRHIVTLEGSFSTPNFFGILMTPVARCNLQDYLAEIDGNLGAERTTFLANSLGCLATALRYLHDSAHITHYDIKPHNILVDGSRVLLADFGIAYDWSQSLQTTIQEPVGRTNLYCAPEVIYFKKISSSADIWSLGCVFLEIATILTGSTIKKLRAHLRETGGRQDEYWNNIQGIRTWGVSHFKGTQLEWVLALLETEARLRPTAATLCTTTIPPFLTSEVRLFGPCCTELDSAGDGGFLKITGSPEAKGSDRLFEVDQEAGLAVLSWPGQHRLYFQGTDGIIREAIHERNAPLWLNINTAKPVGRGKAHSPIAATTVEDSKGLQRRNASELLTDSKAPAANDLTDVVSSRSECTFSTTTIKYKKESGSHCAEDGTLHILHGTTQTWRWRQIGVLAFHPIFEYYLSPMGNTSMVLLNFEVGPHRWFRLYYQGKDNKVHELCLENVDHVNSSNSDDFESPSHPFSCSLGGFNAYLDFDPPAGAGISAIVFVEEARLQMRVYIQGPKTLVQAWYSDEWINPRQIQLDKRMQQETAQKFGVGRMGADVNLYCLKDGSIEEILVT